MSMETLRSTQARLRQRYQETPAAAHVTLVAQGSTLEDITCRLETGHARTLAGMHPGIGGSGREACPGDMLLEALAACAGVTLRAVATSLGVPLRAASVKVEGDLDFRGMMGLSKDVPVGFQNIRLEFQIDGDASDEQLDALMRRTEMFCAVSGALASPPRFTFRRMPGARGA